MNAPATYCLGGTVDESHGLIKKDLSITGSRAADAAGSVQKWLSANGVQ